MTVAVFAIALVLFTLWCLFQFVFVPYRLDIFRHRVFLLRDQLFDEAMRGKIDFSNPVYKATRRLLNTYIRFGHRFSTPYLLAVVIVQPPPPPNLREEAERFIDLFEKLPPEAQQLISGTIAAAHRELILHCLSTSLLARLVELVLEVHSSIRNLATAKPIRAVLTLLRDFDRSLQIDQVILHQQNVLGDRLPAALSG